MRLVHLAIFLTLTGLGILLPSYPMSEGKRMPLAAALALSTIPVLMALFDRRARLVRARSMLQQENAAEHRRDRLAEIMQDYLAPWQWVLMGAAAILQINLLFLMRGDTLISKAIAGGLASLAVMSMFMVKKLDDLSLGE